MKTNKPREGWEDMIKKEIDGGGVPEQLLPDFFNDDDDKDWTW